jgi:serine/threonine protein kinase
VNAERALIRQLVLPYEAMRTLHVGTSEVRLYKNKLSGAYQVGKLIDILGLEESVAVQEAELVRDIRHDNIVPVYDVALVTDPNFPPPMTPIEMIMPYYPRGSVCDALTAGHRFSIGEACAHAQAALRGLGELHENLNILHRDFKSSNVFLTDDDHLLRVGDLGIAVRMDRDGSAESYAHAQLYTPPEVHPTRRVSRRSDIYGMGLLLFEMVVGPLPYATYKLADIERRLSEGKPAPRPADLKYGPYVPPRLRRVINKATARDPVQRFASAHAMSAAISNIELIDWRETCRDDTNVVWEGSTAGSHRLWKVEAHRLKRGGWRLKGASYKNSWRRATSDTDVDQLVGSAATAFFDHLLDISDAS